MRAKRGDHICAIYSTDAELAQIAARFLADGLRNRERCWYVASGGEGERDRRSDAPFDAFCSAARIVENRIRPAAPSTVTPLHVSKLLFRHSDDSSRPRPK